MNVAKKAVPKKLLDSLPAAYRKAEDLIGENGLPKKTEEASSNSRHGRDQLKMKCTLALAFALAIFAYVSPGFRKDELEGSAGRMLLDRENSTLEATGISADQTKSYAPIHNQLNPFYSGYRKH